MAEDYTPPTSAIKAAWIDAHPFHASTQAEEREAEFDRWLADERVRTWDEGGRAGCADQCRALGWLPGTRLAGDEGFGETVIEITALGEREILAKQISHQGQPVDPHEASWTLAARDWHVVRPAPELVTRIAEHLRDVRCIEDAWNQNILREPKAREARMIARTLAAWITKGIAAEPDAIGALRTTSSRPGRDHGATASTHPLARLMHRGGRTLIGPATTTASPDSSGTVP